MSAKEAEEAAAKVKDLKAEVKKLTDENKTLSDNFNTERVSDEYTKLRSFQLTG